MRRSRFKLFLLATFALFTSASPALNDTFHVEDIELVGARRVTLATVLNYVPVEVGDRLTPQMSQQLLKTLYQTGFFKDVTLLRRGDVLVIRVKERPAIAEVNIEGNRKLKDKDINKAFEDAELVQGRIYDDQVLDSMQKELERLYYSVGRYGVKLNSTVTPLPRNRVKIDVDIQEGVTTRIRKINIVGNESVSDEELLGQFELGIPAWYAFLSNKDEYAKNKLSGDLETLRSYYLDRGYINYRLESVQVTISPDRKSIYITLNIDEGAQYKVGEVELSGETVINRDLLLAVVRRANPQGQYFSQKNVTETEEYINSGLGDIGYAFAETRMQPDIHEETNTVDLNFVVDPGKRVYVRRIVFEGNEKTKDEVYRREARQIEGAWYVDRMIERTKIRLQRLPYVEEVKVETPQVSGTEDQVDVVYSLTERLSGSFNIGAGYSDDNGAIFTSSISQNNLFGTGNALSASLSSSQVVKSFSVSYSNPYYTNDGVGRSISLSARRFDTSRTLLTEYVLNATSANINFTVPVSEYSSVRLGVGASMTEIEEQVGISTLEILRFLNEQGSKYEQLIGNFAYVYDTRNRALFPEKGSRHVASVEWNTPGSDLEYVKFDYRANHYWPMWGRSVLHLEYNIGLGEGFGNLNELPFYEKYITGGVHRLRGFRSRSIGPRATFVSTPIRPNIFIGGDAMTVGSLEYILPPFSEREGSARVALFYDFGSVFATRDDFDTDQFRSSVGITMRWLAPVGAMTFSYAEPIKRQPRDEVERFQFSVGGSF